MSLKQFNNSTLSLFIVSAFAALVLHLMGAFEISIIFSKFGLLIFLLWVISEACIGVEVHIER